MAIEDKRMNDSKKISLQLTSQFSDQDLTTALSQSLSELPFINSIKIYEIVTLKDDVDRYDVGAKKHPFKIFNGIKEVQHPHWLKYLPSNLLEFTSPLSIKSDIDNTHIDLYLIKGTDHTTKLIELNIQEYYEEDHKDIPYILDIYKNQLELFDKFEKDFLTGLYNRQTFDEKLMQLIYSNKVDKSRAIKNDSYNWLALMDIDHFKKINDQYGHMYGDEVLILFSEIMRDCFRYNDLVFRYGGEEFVVGLVNINQEGAIIAMERFRKAIEEYQFPSDRKVTVSIGLARILDNELPTTLLDRADKALYNAKDTGRNKLVLADDEIDSNSQSCTDNVVELF